MFAPLPLLGGDGSGSSPSCLVVRNDDPPTIRHSYVIPSMFAPLPLLGGNGSGSSPSCLVVKNDDPPTDIIRLGLEGLETLHLLDHSPIRRSDSLFLKRNRGLQSS